MLSFVRNMIPDRANPIGIDFGSSTLRAVQTERDHGELKIVWAESRPVDADAMNNPAERARFFVDAMKSMLSTGTFKGRKAILALPSFLTHVRHIRTPVFSPDEAREIITREAHGKLPIEPEHCMLRHVIAGEFPSENGTQSELILMAAAKRDVESLLESAARAKLDLVGLVAQPRALVDCFENIYRRVADATAVNLFVDLGANSTRVVVGHSGQLRFARSIPNTKDESTRLIDELELCRRYHESTFADKPISRLIFVGGCAKDQNLCQSIAQAMSLPAQLGDPLVRFNRTAMPQLTAMDRRAPQPEWAVAIGASLGALVTANV
ncbi:MAG TPA: pilus assembly protein PilM [Tepidisphaeraceae bacterium]|nr:pilus assembly protein PilM [Tepidisphaeraceae bacterium]